ncbi:hypothetical protein BS17DRAFT_583368 [Gyrodon lividus]|nr:hypothetical protein BS17DRAFT_583368 [Gyrodon lividus]
MLSGQQIWVGLGLILFSCIGSSGFSTDMLVCFGYSLINCPSKICVWLKSRFRSE